MFRDLRQSGGSRKKRSPTKKQLAALAKGRAVRMRNIRKNKKTKIQRGGGMCASRAVAVPVAEQVEGANDADGTGAGMADVAAPPLPPAAATGAAEDDDSSSSSEDDEA